MIFIVLVFLILLLPLLTNKLKNRKKTYIIFVSIAFVLIAGLRSYMVGTDTLGYVNSFLLSKNISFPVLRDVFIKREVLFIIYQSLIRTITDNYSVYLIPIAIFYICAVSYFIYKYTESPAISYIIFMSMGFFSFSMAGLRQTIAYSILIIATHCLINKKYTKSVLLILLASLFHITSLFYFVVYIIYALPLNAWYLSLIGVATVFAYLRGDTLLLSVVTTVWGNQRSFSDVEYGGISTLILLVVVSTATLLFYPELLQRRKILSQPSIFNGYTKELSVNILFTKLLLFAIPLQLMAIYQAAIFRIATMFHFYMVCIIPNVINKQQNPKSILISKIIVVFLLLLQLFVYTYHAADIIPYTFFWQVN